jgi:hypothetical protein
MSVKELAKFFSTDSFPDLPHSACDICQYNAGIFCGKTTDDCTNEYKADLYEQWLSEELSN